MRKMAGFNYLDIWSELRVRFCTHSIPSIINFVKDKI